jgi:preprotein translocase subunit SecG
MQVLNIFHVLIAISLVALILIQKGQGATAGAAFGSGASGTVFGSRGAGNFLTRTTWVLAALFCSISLTMAVMVSRSSAQPENDLGVVGSSQPAPQVQNTVEENVISVGSEESEGSDLPSFDTATKEVGGSEVINSNAADDLPALNTTATEANERAVTEEVQAVEDGSGGEGSVPNDS